MKKILIFGGTFDPFHLGHERMLKAAINKLHPNLTLIIPNKNPPLKATVPSATVEDRLTMLNLVLKQFPRTQICDYEIKSSSKKKSYTYLTLKYLRQKYPNSQFYLLVGMDRLIDFSNWKNASEIVKDATIVFAGRNNKKYNVKNAIQLNIPETDISSQQLRVTPNKEFLNPKIAKYIAENGIYIQNQIKPLMSIYRFKHTLRVVETAQYIASVNYKNLIKKAYIAAMYHDVAKEFNDEKIIQLVGKDYDKKRFPTIHTLHGCASAKYVKEHFNITDKQIINAINNHVIPLKNASTLDKIIYCADKLEPARTEEDIPNRDRLLKLARSNLNKAYKIVLEYNKSRFK